MTTGVHCPVCKKKLAEFMADGLLKIWCRVCKSYVMIDRRRGAPLS